MTKAQQLAMVVSNIIPRIQGEMEMLKYRNFCKKSLTEINKILGEMGLQLGALTEAKEEKKK